MPGSAGVTTVPSPIGGLNAYDSIAGMPETDALALVNWWPQVYGCLVRKGTRVRVANVDPNARTIATWAANVTSRLLVVSGDALYDVTSSLSTPAAFPGASDPDLLLLDPPLVTGLQSDFWQFTNFANSGGSHFVGFSGLDDGIWLHGDPTAPTVDRLTSTNITGGLDPKDVIDVTIHQRRIWMVEKNTTVGWYMPTDQITGVASDFDFGPLFRHGGFLQSLASWTVDPGVGADDLLCAISSQGDVAVYEGIDPNDPANWKLRGVYYIGKPVSGQRFWDKVGGDLKALTQQGLVSFNDMLTSTKVSPGENTVEARKVQNLLSDLANQLWQLPNWEVKFFAALNMLLINVPAVDDGGPTQYLENVINQSWTEFNGWRANSFTEYDGFPFYVGQAGNIMQAWVGTTDEVSSTNPAGTQIETKCQQAYSYFGKTTSTKQVGMYRPNFLVQADVLYGCAIAYDYEFITPPFGPALLRRPISRWDSAIWDQALWYGTVQSSRMWEQGEGMGFAASLCLATRTDNEVIWVSTDYTLKTSVEVF